MDNYSQNGYNSFPPPGFPQQFTLNDLASSFSPRQSYTQPAHLPCIVPLQPPCITSTDTPPRHVNSFFPSSGLPAFNDPPPSGFPPFNQPPPNYPPPPNSQFSISQPFSHKVLQNFTPRSVDHRFVQPTDFSPAFPSLRFPPPSFSPANDRSFNSLIPTSHLLAPQNYSRHVIQSSITHSEEVNFPYAEKQSQNINFPSSTKPYLTLAQTTPVLKLQENCPASSLDKDWAKKWAEKRHLMALKARQESFNAGLEKQCVSLGQFRKLLAEYISLVNKLKSCGQQSEECRQTCADTCEPPNRVEDADNKDLKDENRAESDSLTAAVDPTEILARMKEIRRVIDDKDVLQGIQDRLARASKKRMRLKRKRKEQYEEEQERERKRERLEVEIAQWKNDVCAKELEIKKEKEVKKAADEILSEVRRKLSEGRRSVKLLEHLRKLRAVRKEKALQKKNRVPKESDEIFEERVGAMTETMKQQIAMYEAEEQTLEVMLDMEQEESLVIERIARRKKERERLQQYETQLKTFLFGEDDVPRPSDPLFPYRQFYDVSLHSLAAFVRIRQDWDMFCVKDESPGGSSVPLGWVVPAEPSSEIWASALSITDENT